LSFIALFATKFGSELFGKVVTLARLTCQSQLVLCLNLRFADELETQIVALSLEGSDDQIIAQQLSAQGYRSPLGKILLPSTVKTIRLKHQIFQNRSQSHPRQVAGYLTIPQLAKAVELPPHWLYDRIHKGTIAIKRNEATGLYLFPDLPDTLEQIKKLKTGQIQNLRF
jgi:hypothetical protein